MLDPPKPQRGRLEFREYLIVWHTRVVHQMSYLDVDIFDQRKHHNSHINLNFDLSLGHDHSDQLEEIQCLIALLEAFEREAQKHVEYWKAKDTPAVPQPHFCETCLHWDTSSLDNEHASCRCPLPISTQQSLRAPMRRNWGQRCPCWKERKADETDPH